MCFYDLESFKIHNECDKKVLVIGVYVKNPINILELQSTK